MGFYADRYFPVGTDGLDDDAKAALNIIRKEKERMRDGRAMMSPEVMSPFPNKRWMTLYFFRAVERGEPLPQNIVKAVRKTMALNRDPGSA